MPKKHSVVTLSDEERHHINGLNRKGTIAARTLARAQILRLADEGKSDAEIVEALGVGLSTVERTRKSTWKPAGPGNQRAVETRPPGIDRRSVVSPAGEGVGHHR